jgi:chromosome segregation ATPase
MDDEAKPYLLSEAAELIGVSVNALRKRITRRKMRANRSNEDGLWRVWLTSSEIQEAKAGRLDEQADERRAFKVLKGETATLRAALSRERNRADKAEAELAVARALADQRAAELAEMRERAARAEGEAAALRTQGQADRERAAQLVRERDTAQANLAEMRRVLGQAAGAAAGLQEAVKIAEAGRHDAESRAAAVQGERDVAIRRAEEAELQSSKTQTRLAQVEAEAEAARGQGVDLAELEAAQARAREAEQQVEGARRLADEAERRAMAATSRLDRIQRARIDEAHAAALAARTNHEATSPSIWQRIFGRARRS